MWPRTSPVWDATSTWASSTWIGRGGCLPKLATRRIRPEDSDVHGQPALNQFAQVIQADLDSIGIRSSVEVLEAAAATALLSQGSFPGMITNNYAYATQDPAMIFTAFPFRTTGNAAHFESDDIAAWQTPRAASQIGKSDSDSIVRSRVCEKRGLCAAGSQCRHPMGPPSTVRGVTGDPFSSAPFLEGINVD